MEGCEAKGFCLWRRLGLLGRGKGSRLGHPWSAAFPATMAPSPSPGLGPGRAALMVLQGSVQMERGAATLPCGNWFMSGPTSDRFWASGELSSKKEFSPLEMSLF